jgi:hypothetical protein
MLHRVQKIMRCHKPFGILLKAGSAWSDDVTQKYLNSTYVSFEDSLDMLPGRTAGMLRLHRFSTWYDSNSTFTYLKELERISSNVKIKLHMLKEQYTLMLAFYPLSTVMQRIRKQLDLPPSLRFPTSAMENRWDENELARYYGRYYGQMSVCDIGGQELEEIRQFKEVWMDCYRDSGAPRLSVSLRFGFSFKLLFSDRGWNEFLSRCKENQELLSEESRGLS